MQDGDPRCWPDQADMRRYRQASKLVVVRFRSMTRAFHAPTLMVKLDIGNFCAYAPQESEAVDKIERVRFGKFEIDCWYMSPYPEECRRPTLYVCHQCFKYMNSVLLYDRHLVREHQQAGRQSAPALAYCTLCTSHRCVGPGQVHHATAARRRDLPQGQDLRLRGRRQEEPGRPSSGATVANPPSLTPTLWTKL